MDISQFNYRSVRARKARLAVALQPWIFVFKLLAAILLLFGSALIIVDVAIGWGALGLSAIPLMTAIWYKRELQDIPAVRDGSRIDDLVDSEILGLLSPQPSPKELAAILSKTNGGVFFTARFGVGGSFLGQLVSESRDETPGVFSEALSIAQTVGNRMSAGVLVLALFRTIPSRETLLGHLQLDEEDLMSGIRWYHHLQDMMVARSKVQRTGGIGRDWSFGWIPTLSRYGVNLSDAYVGPDPTRAQYVEDLIDTLGSGRGSMALVGQTGVGKTEAVYQLAHRLMQPTARVPHKLWYHQVFLLDASRLVGAAGDKGSLEGLVSAILSEAYAAKNVIICLDNAQVFFEDGVGSVDISTLLLPILTAGRLPIILAMDEQRYLQIGARLPEMVAGIRRISVPPANETESLLVMQDKLPQLEYRFKVTYMYQALKEAYKLSSRYVYDISMPGQAISLLESAAENADQGLVTVESVQRAIEKTTGVKTSGVNDAEEREKLLNLEALIHERMIGQDRAVKVVSDALRRARAGVRNQQRPVGTFLFLGPTGVGKTELAKSLASAFYGGEGNIIRLDMNEFVRPEDVSRLIADGTQDGSSLTAQVMKQPFSVILLDELEKAHSTVLTTLLQLLDEGILRDERNREVSFRDTIVIATSNAGAQRIQEYIQRGYQLEQFEQTFIDELISSTVFHPEFLNRFDEMIVFRPLTKPELLQVVDLILVSVNKNLASQKVTVVVAQDAKEYLVEMGYDPRLGARPMRRVVQRAVESTVAKLLIEQLVTPGGTIEITLEQVQAILGGTQQVEQVSLPQ